MDFTARGRDDSWLLKWIVVVFSEQERFSLKGKWSFVQPWLWLWLQLGSALMEVEEKRRRKKKEKTEISI